MPFKDPAQRKAYKAEWDREHGGAGQSWEASRERWERSQPPHYCEYRERLTGPDGKRSLGPRCPHLTRARQVKGQGWAWNRYCSEHQVAGSRLAKHAALSVRPGYGPGWQNVINKKIGDANRKPASERKRKALDKARKKHKPRSPEFMRLISMGGRAGHEKGIQSKTAIELLILEDQVTAADAKMYIRKVIERRDGRRPDYTLEEIRGYVREGHPPKRIASRIGRSDRWARQLVSLVNQLDAGSKTEVRG